MFGRRLAHDLFELVHQRLLGLFEPLRVGLGQGEHVAVRGPDLLDPDGLGRVHLAHHPLGELDRLQARAERRREEALDDTAETSLEVTKDGHGYCFRWSEGGSRGFYPAHRARNPRARLLRFVPARASGGIGRRAGFRFLCPQGRGGSTPPSPTGRGRRDPPAPHTSLLGQVVERLSIISFRAAAPSTFSNPNPK